MSAVFGHAGQVLDGWTAPSTKVFACFVGGAFQLGDAPLDVSDLCEVPRLWGGQEIVFEVSEHFVDSVHERVAGAVERVHQAVQHL